MSRRLDGIQIIAQTTSATLLISVDYVTRQMHYRKMLDEKRNTVKSYKLIAVGVEMS
jgi:hypothetical protein